MKTLGMIGGIGPESTIDYYRHLISGYRSRVPDGSAPRLLINSIDVQKVLELAAQTDRSALARYLLEELRTLVRGGAEVAFLSANTPHIVFDELRRELPIPLVSIVEATCRHASLRGFRRPGLFGTRFTMQAGFYQRMFTDAGLELIVPESGDQDFIHEKYVTELAKGTFLPQTREALVAIAHKLKETRRIDSLVLGGTELPLILKSDAELGIPRLDTTRIHVEAVLDEAFS
jgi:aspartate racemase